MWLFLTVPWVGLQCVIVIIPDHTHLHFEKSPATEPIFYGDITFVFKRNMEKHICSYQLKMLLNGIK